MCAHAPSASSASSSAGPRQWAGLAVLALPTLLLSLDASVLHLAVPQLGADLAPGPTQMLWIIDVYGFVIAGLLVPMGVLGDRVGRRRLLTVGAAAFGAASVAAACSTGPEMLIAARTLMGVAGATLMPSTLSLIGTMFRDPRQRGLAVGLWALTFSAGFALGPVVGGVMLRHLWWGSVFLLAVPVMGLLLVAAPFLLPEHRVPGAGRLDPAAVALSLATTLPITYGVKELPVQGPRPAVVAAVVLGVVAGAAFVRRQRRSPAPMLDLRLFRDRALTGALTILLFGAAVGGGIYLFAAQYLQLVQGLSPLTAGLWLLPAAAALGVGSLVAPIAARRLRPGHVVAAGLVVAAAGFLLLAQADAVWGPPPVVAGLALVFLGSSPATALGTDLVVGSAPQDKAGAASALGETSTELGVALGVAVLGSAGTAVYRDRLGEAVPADARDTLAGAVSAAERLPAPVGDRLLASARDAFTAGMAAAALTCLVIALVLAVVAARALRHVPPAGRPER
ncbi:MFS transporter [Actinomadura miaoliensis]|uniref:MFS transporter n=1 Tax=Actinomadura miaoliensis TaxID=430685 RepID=A0ABP7VNA0_9ACTN